MERALVQLGLRGVGLAMLAGVLVCLGVCLLFLLTSGRPDEVIQESGPSTIGAESTGSTTIPRSTDAPPSCVRKTTESKTDQTLAGFTYKMRPIPDGWCRMHGRVAYQDGTPVDGSEVHAFCGKLNFDVCSRRTGATGEFVFHFQKPSQDFEEDSGPIRIRAFKKEKRLFGMTELIWDGKTEAIEVPEVVLPLAQEDVYDLMVEVRVNSTLSQGSLVEIRAKDSDARVHGYTDGTTDSFGRVYFSCLRIPGTYQLAVFLGPKEVSPAFVDSVWLCTPTGPGGARARFVVDVPLNVVKGRVSCIDARVPVYAAICFPEVADKNWKEGTAPEAGMLGSCSIAMIEPSGFEFRCPYNGLSYVVGLAKGFSPEFALVQLTPGSERYLDIQLRHREARLEVRVYGEANGKPDYMSEVELIGGDEKTRLGWILEFIQNYTFSHARLPLRRGNSLELMTDDQGTKLLDALIPGRYTLRVTGRCGDDARIHEEEVLLIEGETLKKTLVWNELEGQK